MKFNTLNKGDLTLSAISFGAWAIGGWMWGGADKKDALDALAAAMDYDITTIDTAPVYGFGLSEELVGKAIKGKRDKLQILTKYGLRWDGTAKGAYYFDTKSNSGQALKIYKYSSKESIIQECEQSLQRLGTDYIDLYQMHWTDETTPVSESMEAMQRLHEQGKIRYAGVCNFNLDELKDAMNHFPVAAIQNPYSMLRRSMDQDILPFCRENGIGVLAYSPLQRGILTGKIKAGHQFGEGDSRPNTPYYKEPNFSNILAFIEKVLTPIAKQHEASVGQVAINWSIQQPGMTTALVGARNRSQVIQNAESVRFMLSNSEIETINNALDDLKMEKV